MSLRKGVGFCIQRDRRRRHHMGRVSFTQELKALAKAGEGIDAGGCRREVTFLHRELGRQENALGRAAWMMRYGQRGEWRGVLREAAAETLREARRAASVYDVARCAKPWRATPGSPAAGTRRSRS
jgi:hypothetical protein